MPDETDLLERQQNMVALTEDEEALEKRFSKIIDRDFIERFPVNWVDEDALYQFDAKVRIHERRYTFDEIATDPKFIRRTGCKASFGAYDLGGHARTNKEGRYEWRLSNFVCLGNNYADFSTPLSLVTTASGRRPAIMTVLLRDTGRDVVFDVLSLALNGDPLPGVKFYWRCWAEGGSYVEP